MTKKRYTNQSSGSAASKAGQIIGEAFERVVIQFIADYLQQAHKSFEILQPEEGRQLIALETLGGTLRRLDTVIISKESEDPVAVLETKWLKDARHHNDKGAWILQLKEIRKRYPTVRGAAAVLAGYWTEGVGVVFMSEAEVRMILVATDSEVYSTLQPHLDEYLKQDSFILDPLVMRRSYPRPWDIANLLIDLNESGVLDNIARQWLNFKREAGNDNTNIVGADLIREAIDQLLSSPPSDPKINKFEIALHIETGNLIYEEFEDIEALMELIQTYTRDSKAILKRISPKKRARGEGS